jgi:hypothetical protein
MSLKVWRPDVMIVLASLSITGLSGCGPAGSDSPTEIGSRTSALRLPKPQPVSQIPITPHPDSFTQAANLLPPPPVKSEYELTPEPQQQAVPEHLTLSPLMAQALDAPEASVRRQALDLWAQQGTEAPLDPLVVAVEDEDDEVRTRAMEIIEQHWAIEQHAEPEAKH